MWRFKDIDPYLIPYANQIQTLNDDNGLTCGGTQVCCNQPNTVYIKTV